jgi:hypothetical protein
MAYKNYTAITEGAPETEVTGFDTEQDEFNGVYSLVNKQASAKNRRWIKDTSIIAFNFDQSIQRWEIYKQRSPAKIAANSVSYTRNTANDTETSVGWANGSTWRYTAKANPSTSDYAYTDPELSNTETRERITQYVQESRDVAAYSTEETAVDDPINCAWTVGTVVLVAVAVSQQIIPAVPGKEVAIITVEAYNQSDADGNLTFIRKNPDGDIVFQFSIGLVSLETVAMNHKMLIPEGYTMEVSATVRGIRVCLNCSETEVV